MESDPSSDVLSIIRGFYSSLSISEKKVADYILANLPDTIRMTLADVGHESGVSDATVLRFCRSIGYKRWLEFKVDLIRTLPGSPEQILDDVDSNDSPGMIAKKVFNSSIQALTDTLTVLDDAG
ncbi:MAG TPA: MurR/RpiR family transcriptional regulator, partial [Anaerolineales bacterium]|nr:MurR/RpiR family transcriptional regulator [Anaerolineales bacterium]